LEWQGGQGWSRKYSGSSKIAFDLSVSTSADVRRIEEEEKET